MEENAQEATRKATQISTQLSKHSPIKIKTLFAYLEKLLHILNILQFYIFAISKQLFYIEFIEKRYFFIEIFVYVRNLLYFCSRIQFGTKNSEFNHNKKLMAIIVNIDVMMAKRKISSQELAEKIGITQANLSILKTGKAKAVRFSTLEAICNALDCQPGDILEYRTDEVINN